MLFGFRSFHFKKENETLPNFAWQLFLNRIEARASAGRGDRIIANLLRILFLDAFLLQREHPKNIDLGNFNIAIFEASSFRLRILELHLHSAALAS